MRNKTFYLTSISLIAALGGFLFGFDTAVISGTVGFVKNQFALSSIAEGWFVGSALLGCIIGVISAGYLSDRFGRKKLLLLSSLLFFISALGCTLASGHTSLIMFRLVGGIGVGVASMLSPMYISEISPPAIRGRLVTLYQFAITIGILLAYFSNSSILSIAESNAAGKGLLHLIYSDEVWRGMFSIELLPALVFFLLLFIIPESPRWLISKGKDAKAKETLQNVLYTVEMETEYKMIKSSLKEKRSSLRVLLKPGLRWALLIGILLPVFSQLSGINAIIYYGPSILKNAGLTINDALGGQVTIGIVNVLFTIVAILLIDKTGRKTLLLIGIAGAMLSLAAAGILTYTENQNGSLFLICILTFIASFAFSLGPIPWIIISEIFPTHIRGRAVSIGTFAIWGTNFLVGLLFPLMHNSEIPGPGGSFLFFAFCCLLAFLFTLKYIPETKGKSLEEIEKIFSLKGDTRHFA
jgi:MFS transporter, SP family, arabinose:H+ symporter